MGGEDAAPLDKDASERFSLLRRSGGFLVSTCRARSPFGRGPGPCCSPSPPPSRCSLQGSSSALAAPQNQMLTRINLALFFAVVVHSRERREKKKEKASAHFIPLG